MKNLLPTCLIASAYQVGSHHDNRQLYDTIGPHNDGYATDDDHDVSTILVSSQAPIMSMCRLVQVFVRRYQTWVLM